MLKDKYGFNDLLHIMELLRGENGCPWDLEQTHQSIRQNMIEEAYEAVEAIDRSNPTMLCEELGDVMLQVVFHSQMAKEEGNFDIDSVTDGICKKLILRHPHIFGDIKVSDSAEVLKNWDIIKKSEKQQKTTTDTLNSVSVSLPALMRTQKVQKRAAKSSLGQRSIKSVLSDLELQIGQLKSAVEQDDKSVCFDAVGDVLFSAANAAELVGVDAELALVRACEKFIGDFECIERISHENNNTVD